MEGKSGAREQEIMHENIEKLYVNTLADKFICKREYDGMGIF
jgi:hypothetical protein